MVQEDVIVITSRNETIDAEDPSTQGILAKYLLSNAGRRQLGQSMVAPLRRSLDYQAISRRIFNVDPLPQGALPVYDKEVIECCIDESDVYYTSDNRMGDPNNFYLPIRKVKSPTFEVYDCPTIKLSDIKERRFSMLDRLTVKAKAEIAAAEDQAIFDILGDISNPLDIKSGNKSL